MAKQETLDELKQRLVAMNKISVAQKELLAMSEKELEVLKNIAGADLVGGRQLSDIAQERIDALGRISDAQQKHIENLEAQEKTEENILEINKLKKENILQQIKSYENLISRGEALTNDQEQHLSQLKQQNAEIDNIIKNAKKGTAELKALGTQLGALFGQFADKDYIGKIKPLFSIFSNGWQGILDFGKALLASSVTNFINSVIGLSIKLYDAEVSFMRATSSSKQFSQALVDSYQDVRKYGISIDEVSKANISLYKTYTDFSRLSSEQRVNLSNIASTMDKLGYSTDNFSKTTQSLTKGLSITGEAAAKTVLDLSAFAVDIGIPIEKMGSDLAANSSMIALLGNNAVRSMKDLELASKITGLEVGKILSITQKFDTFEGAAKQVGTLNAALGGNFLNTMDLIMAENPADRFRMIRDSILDTGMSFDQMTYQQKKFYTESLGLSDVSELAMILSGDLDSLNGNFGKTSSELIEMQKRVQATNKVGETFTIFLQNLIPVVQPVIDAIADFNKWLQESEDNVEKVQNAMIGLAGVLTVGFIGSKLLSLVSLLSRLAGGAGSAGGAIDSLGSSLGSLLKPLADNAKGLAALGVAVLGIGLGIGAAAYGISMLALAFKDMDIEKIIATGVAIMLLNGAIIALVAITIGSGGTAEVALLALGAAVVMMGAGVAAAAYGLSLLINEISKLDANKVSAVIAISSAISTLGLAFASLANPITSLGMITFTGMLAALSLIRNEVRGLFTDLAVAVQGINNIEIDKINAVKEFFVEVKQTTPQQMLQTMTIVRDIQQANPPQNITPAPQQNITVSLAGTQMVLQVGNQKFDAYVIETVANSIVRGTSS